MATSIMTNQFNKSKVLNIISGILAAMFFYASFSKLSNYEKASRDMANQIFPPPIAAVLTWLIPSVEIVVIALLMFPKTQKAGIWASMLLLTAFTGYIGLVMTGVFGRIPCSCGGILQRMSYGTHLLFNLFFIALSVLGIFTMRNSVPLRLIHFFKRKDFTKNFG